MITRRHFGQIIGASATLAAASGWRPAWADTYPAPVPLKAGAQADNGKLPKPQDISIAYLPPGTEFDYYIAIGVGIKAAAAKAGVKTFMLATQSGSDINGQMGMIQDAITRKVSAIILSTHDENAAAPLVKRAIAQGIAVVIVNSDILDFPTPVTGVVGYSQHRGTEKLGQYFLQQNAGKGAKIGIIEGLPGYHSTQRVGGFLSAVKGKPGIEIRASLPGNWNTEGGNSAGMDMLQAHPDIDTIFAANDYMIMGAQLAAQALGRRLTLLGNDGDPACLEEIAAGKIDATVNTTPVIMGQIAFAVTMDALTQKFAGGFVETPSSIVDKSNVLSVLRQPDLLYPKPSRVY